jgi:sugar phosphate isomerase/epimerase
MTPQHRIGFCSWSVQPASPAELAAAAKSLGLNALQLALVPMLDPLGDWPDAIEILADSGIEVLSGMVAALSEDYSTLDSIACTGGVRSDDLWSENRRRFELAAKVAAAHDLRLVTFHAGFLPEDRSDAGRDAMLDRLRFIADYFASANIEVALETGQETARTLLDALEDLDCPNVGVNFDPANMILYGRGDPVAALRTLSRYVMQIHIKDALPTSQPGTWGREMPVGRGAVDWPAFFEVACAIDPPVNFVIEREAGPDRLDDIRSAAALVAQSIARCNSPA